jgi:hypothetical protein
MSAIARRAVSEPRLNAQKAHYWGCASPQPQGKLTHMPNLGPQRGKTTNRQGSLTGHRCVLCHQALHLVRRHVSPVRLGASVTIEFYQCDACDSGFALNPATGKWKRWVTEDD